MNVETDFVRGDPIIFDFFSCAKVSCGRDSFWDTLYLTNHSITAIRKANDYASSM